MAPRDDRLLPLLRPLDPVVFDAPFLVDADVFALNLKPARKGAAYRLTVILDTATTFKLKVKKTGGATLPLAPLFEGASLVASSPYSTVLDVREGFEYNFAMGAGGKVLYLAVSEVLGAVA